MSYPFQNLYFVDCSGDLVFGWEFALLKLGEEQFLVYIYFKSTATAFHKFNFLHLTTIFLFKDFCQTGCPWLIVSGSAILYSNVHLIYFLLIYCEYIIILPDFIGIFKSFDVVKHIQIMMTLLTYSPS